MPAANVSGGAARAAVLIVDDHEPNRIALEAVLAPLRHDIVAVRSGAEAVQAVKEREFACVLLDVQMPGLDGFETAALIKASEQHRHLPILFVTAKGREEHQLLRGYLEGAADYIVKPYEPEVIRAKVRVFVDLHLRERDVRAREAELARRQFEQRTTLLADAMPAIAWISRPDGTTDYYNQRWYEYTGLAKEGTAPDSWRAVCHPDDVEPVLESWEQCYRTSQAFEHEVRLCRASDGSYRWHLARAVPVHGLDGSVLQWIGTSTDIQDVKEAREQIELERARLHALFTEAPAAIALCRGPDHVYELSNPRNHDIIGPRDVLGKSVREVMPEPEAAKVIAVLDRIYRTGEPYRAREFHYKVRHESGELVDRYFNVAWQATRDARGNIDGVALFGFDVTEQVLARNELRLHSRVLDSMTEGVSVTDESGVILYTNPAEDRMFGYERGELLGRHVSVLNAYAPEENERFVAGVIAQLKENEEWSGELLNRRKDGTLFVTFARVTGLKMGNTSHWVCVQRDITDERRIQEQFELITEMLPVLVAYMTPDGYFRMNNAAHEQWFGRPRSDMTNRHMREVFGDVAFELLRPYFERALQGEHVSYELPMPFRGGSRYIQATYTPHVGPSGAVQGVVSMVQDITERKVAEAKLRESESRFRNMADNAPVKMWVTDATGACTYRSKRWQEFTGQTEEQGLGEGWLSVVHPDDRGPTREAFRAANERHEPFRFEYRLRRRDGVYRWAIDSGSPRVGLRGEFLGFIGSVIDITERKRVEEERERVVRDLADAVRTRDEFLSVASHELKTPITPLSLKLQALASAARAGVTPRLMERLPRDLDTMLRQTMRLTDLVEALLDVSRIGHGLLELTPETLDLNLLVSEVASRFEPQAERARSKIVLDAKGVIEGSWDRLRVDQVVSNLLSNAIKYGRGAPIELKTEANETHARLSVRDRGIGIAPEALSRIFDKFERAVSEHNYGGLGLGLYVTKQILDAMGGSIVVESTPGGGATFTVSLPRRSVRAEVRPRAVREA